MIIQEQTIWRNRSNGTTYRVLWVHGNEVIAWSQPVNTARYAWLDIGGYAWLGERSQFVQEFQPAFFK